MRMLLDANFIISQLGSKGNFATAAKVLSFMSLPAGWHYGSGKAPSRELTLRVLRFHALMGDLGLRETDAFPGEDGEILLRAYVGDRCAGFLFETDGSVSLSLEDGDVEEFSQENASEAEAFALASKIAGTCDTYGSLVRGTSIAGRAGSSNSPSRKTLPTTSHQLLMRAVSSRPAAQSALIYESIIHRASPETHQYSGPSTVPYYPAAQSSQRSHRNPEMSATGT